MMGVREIAAGAVLAFTASPVLGQDMDQQFFIEVRGGVNVPTFDIADAADPGVGLGGTFGVMVAPRVWLMAEGDFGFHKSAVENGPDVDVFHYIGKVGYTAFENEKVSVLLNAGAGAMTFNVDGGETNTYPAINVGGKIAFTVSEQLAIVVSPQGDIAFSKEEDVGTSNSWVWPFTAGLRVNF